MTKRHEGRLYCSLVEGCSCTFEKVEQKASLYIILIAAKIKPITKSTKMLHDSLFFACEWRPEGTGDIRCQMVFKGFDFPTGDGSSLWSVW